MLDQELLNKINLELEKSLPSMQISMLKQFFETAKKNEDELKNAKDKIERLTEERDCLREDCSKLRSLKNSMEELNEKQTKLNEEKAAFEFEKKHYQMKFEYEQKLAKQTFDMFNTVFANNLVKQKVYGFESESRSTNGRSTPSGWVEGEQVSTSRNIDKTTEIQQ